MPNCSDGVIVLNAELRVGVTRRIQAAGFMDSGNVWSKASDIDLFELRASPGFGIRIATPVGPIRFDIGFKLDRRELSPGRVGDVSAEGRPAGRGPSRAGRRRPPDQPRRSSRGVQHAWSFSVFDRCGWLVGVSGGGG